MLIPFSEVSMRRFPAGGWWLSLWGVLVLGCAVPVRAAPDTHAEGPAKYKVTVHTEDGKESEETFDLSKPGEADVLAGLIREGKVEHLQKDKPVNILALSWDLGLWTLVVFILLLLILSKLAWRPMLEGLQKREANIRGAIEEAQKAREEAQTARAQLQKQLDHAGEQVRDMLDEARRDAQHTTDEMVAKARGEIQTERDRLRREIDTAKDQALKHIWEQSAQLATLISAKAIRRQLSADDHRRLVDEALGELREAGQERVREVQTARA
jgi:F-type H+-transporting ATPase subunit b